MIAARNFQIHFKESLAFHKGWPDMAEMVKEQGHEFQWSASDAALNVIMANPAGLIRVGSSQLTGAVIGGVIAGDLITAILKRLSPEGLSHLHSVVTTSSPLKGAARRNRSRSGRKLVGDLGAHENALITQWAVRMTQESTLDAFEYVDLDVEILERDEMKKRMPDEGKLGSLTLPKVGVWAAYRHHHHGHHAGPLDSVVEGLDAAADEATRMGGQAFSAIGSAIQ